MKSIWLFMHIDFLIWTSYKFYFKCICFLNSFFSNHNHIDFVIGIQIFQSYRERCNYLSHESIYICEFHYLYIHKYVHTHVYILLIFKSEQHRCQYFINFMTITTNNGCIYLYFPKVWAYIYYLSKVIISKHI